MTQLDFPTLQLCDGIPYLVTPYYLAYFSLLIFFVNPFPSRFAPSAKLFPFRFISILELFYF